MDFRSHPNIKREFNKLQVAQAMLEFALALPILLILVLGLMETGRLLFIYASTVSAAREAARYGSAVGRNADNIPYFEDCEGIRAAARNVAFINEFTDENIIITYDGGLYDDTSGGHLTGDRIPLDPDNPNDDPACGSFDNIQNGHRIKVSVTTHWEPIVSLVPLNPLDITSTSQRTIIRSISISAPKILTSQEKTATVAAATAGVQTATAAAAKTATSVAVTATAAVAQTATAAAAQTATAASIHQTQTAIATPQKIILFVSPTNSNAPLSLKVGDLFTYTFVMQNINNFDITNTTLSITGNFAISQDGDCDGTIPANSSISCKGTGIISKSDIERGFIDNTALAGGSYNTFFGSSTIQSDPVARTQAIVQKTSLSVTASGSPSEPSAPNLAIMENTIITYTYKLTNNGNVAISPSVSDIKSGNSLTCSGVLEPGVTKECTGTYKVQNSDINTGSILNTGSAYFTFGGINTSIPTSINVTTHKCTSANIYFSAKGSNSSGGNNNSYATWTIQNNSGASINITKINISWNAQGSRNLVQVFFPTTTTSIWTGTSNSGSGFDVPASSSLTLAPGTSSIRLKFNKNTDSITVKLTLQPSYCPIIQ